MENKEVLSTLNEIRDMMQKSSKFLTLSGMSAVLVGIYACVAAVIACNILGSESGLVPDFADFPQLRVNMSRRLQMMEFSAAVLILLCIGTVYAFSCRKAKKQQNPLVFNITARRFLWSFFLPLIVGGILCLALIYKQEYGLMSDVMLIFYGIALVNASSYTYSNTRFLGYAELALGLTGSFIDGHALLFWMLGFGVFHIVYGVFVYLKYDRTPNVNRQGGDRVAV
jgi:heme/copper-type cytochrome/quinol oxidase subunit 2